MQHKTLVADDKQSLSKYIRPRPRPNGGCCMSNHQDFQNLDGLALSSTILPRSAQTKKDVSLRRTIKTTKTMKIVNPLYDGAFKYLMDNEQIAKSVLSIILGQAVLSLQSKPQELLPGRDEYSVAARYDFKAVIRNEHNEDRTVLIEIQKYNSSDTIGRFREYLAEAYKKQETIINTLGKEVVQSLPIITIYILGYNISKYPALALKAQTVVKDLIWDEVIDEKPDFIELLTHESIILQVNAKPKRFRNTRLEYFLGLFVQKLRNEESNYVVDIELSNEAKTDGELQNIVKHLNAATLNENVLRGLKFEESFEKGLKDMAQQLAETKVYVETVELKAKAAEEQAKAAEEQAKAERLQREAAEEQAKSAEEQAKADRKEREAAQQQALAVQQKIITTIKKLHAKGFTLEEIAESTELSTAEVAKILAQ